jgi:hypothetical protein
MDGQGWNEGSGITWHQLIFLECYDISNNDLMSV